MRTAGFDDWCGGSHFLLLLIKFDRNQFVAWLLVMIEYFSCIQ